MKLCLICALPVALVAELSHAQSEPLLLARTGSPAALVDEAPRDGIFVTAAPGAPTAGLRGPGSQTIFDSISGCTSVRAWGGGPAAILDDLSFSPGPAAAAGAIVSGIDFYIRTWGPVPRITVRLTFFNRLDPAGEGAPLIVQHEPVSQQFVVFENAPANTGPAGSYLTSVSLAPFVITGDPFALEIAFVNDDGTIIPNGTLSTVFPGNPCIDSQPAIGSSQERFWIDNDFGNLTGDDIRYEPPSPSTPGDQGDELVWGGAMPADNVLAVRLRGVPIEPTVGACCSVIEPFECVLRSVDECAAAGGVFIGSGEPCIPVFLCVPPPPNDDCENAVPINGEGLHAFDTRGADSTGPSDCDAGGPSSGIASDVWFRWSAPCDGPFRFTTCGHTVTDDRIAAYDGVCGALAPIICNDNGCADGLGSEIVLDAIAGREYLLRLGATPNTPGGQGFLEVTLAGPCTAPCAADFDGNRLVEVPDIFEFLGAWFRQEPRAWFFGGEVGVPAIFAFLSEWFAADGEC